MSDDLPNFSAVDALFENDGKPAPEPVPQSKPRRGRSTGRATPKPKAKVPPYKNGQFIGPLTEIYSAIGAMVVMFDPPVGKAILGSAEACAESLDNLARENESVRRALIALTTGGAWGAVAIAHTPIIMAILFTHVPQMKMIAPNLAPSEGSENGTGDTE